VSAQLAVPAAAPATPVRRAALEAAALFVVALVFFRWKLGQLNGFADYDGHFHLMVAHWIAAQGLWTDFPWLPFTVLGARGPDHQWLWHLTLLPFTAISDPAQALAWAAAFNGAATAAATAFVMRLLGVPAAPVFAVLAMTAGISVPERFMMLRAQNIALIYMLLAVWAMARGRHRTLGALAFLFLESYHAAVVLLPMALIGAAARSYEARKAVVTPVVAVAAGMTLALIVSPWFPRNIDYLLFHTLFKTAEPVRGEHVSALIGTEWYPSAWINIWWQSWPAHLMLVAGLAALAWRRHREPGFRPGADTLMAIGTAALSLYLYYRAVRFAEYYVPFAVFAAGLAARDAGLSFPLRRWRTALFAAWALAAASVGVAAVDRVARLPADYLARAGARINETGLPGEMVFNSLWTDFMALVWWAPAFRYVNGLDGHYLAYGDPARSAIWIALLEGVADDPATVMMSAFGARFAVISRQHGKLAEQLMNNPRAVLLLTAPEAWLFELRPEAAPPR
jgi:hypothetical protein